MVRTEVSSWCFSFPQASDRSLYSELFCHTQARDSSVGIIYFKELVSDFKLGLMHA